METAPTIHQILSLTAVQRNYQELWNDCTVEEQVLLQSLAQGVGRLPSAAWASESLLNVGLIAPEGDQGGFRITSPIFAAFIRQQQKGAGNLILQGNIAYRAGVEVARLTPLEARLLAGLLQSPGVACSKEQLIQHLFEQQADGSQDDRLAQLVKRLRQKIEVEDGSWTYIENLHGVGYRLQQPS